MSDEIKDLREEIAKLRERVAVLEAARPTYVPSVGPYQFGPWWGVEYPLTVTSGYARIDNVPGTTSYTVGNLGDLPAITVTQTTASAPLACDASGTFGVTS